MRALARLALLLALSGALPALAQEAEEPGPDPGAELALPPDPVLTQLNKRECRKLGKKIVHYTNVAARAEERGDALWEGASVAHVDRLEARWNSLCGHYEDTWSKQVTELLKEAGVLALRYFTFGAY
ncbi:hypothetical protein MYXO_01223 [Myxococcaceae bacterium]|nr:hypothetical protein MYXO_01223 [Myxococcaceae bacterium]